MTNKELMIGDWVQSEQLVAPARYSGFFRHYPEPVSGKPYTRLECLYEGGREGGEVPENKVMPIQLTPEILEKNGFSYEYEDGWGFAGKDYEPLITCVLEEHFVQIENNGLTAELRIQYVHELQHALRISGLNDLADSIII